MSLVSDPSAIERSTTTVEDLQVRRCLNCDAALDGAFCSQCGQSDKPSTRSVGELAKDMYAEFIGFDKRFLDSLRLLFTKPGQLTVDYAGGRRKRYVQPSKLFFLVCLLLFFAASKLDPLTVRENLTEFWSDPATVAGWQQSGLPKEAFIDKVDDKINGVMPTVILVLFVPLYALTLKLLYIRRRRSYALHLIFSMHFFCFFFLAIIPMLLLPSGGELQAILVLATPAVYLLLSMKRVYEQSWLKTSLKMSIAWFVCMLVVAGAAETGEAIGIAMMQP